LTGRPQFVGVRGGLIALVRSYVTASECNVREQGETLEAWLGLIGAIVGAFAGWALSESTKALSNRRRALRKLETSAFVCLDRLLKTKNADDRGDAKQRDGEIYHLGGDLDKYRDAIAQCPGKRKEHWALYRQTIPLLLEHDLSGLDDLISKYEENSRIKA